MKSPTLAFRDSLEEVHELMLLHATLTGTGPGRRHKVEVLNKSAILFMCASFEAFIENLATQAFDFIVSNSPSANKLPTPIRKLIAETIKADKNELKVWDLADSGWKVVASQHKKSVIDKHIGHFNTPKHGNIESLLKSMVAFHGTEKGFTWRNMRSKNSKDKLRAFVELRGTLAHGEKPAPKVRKAEVEKYLEFLAPLSVRLSNEICLHVENQVGKQPWPLAHFKNIQ